MEVLCIGLIIYGGVATVLMTKAILEKRHYEEECKQERVATNRMATNWKKEKELDDCLLRSYRDTVDDLTKQLQDLQKTGVVTNACSGDSKGRPNSD